VDEMTGQQSHSQHNGASTKEARFALHRTVVMVGMMGSGKTAIGRALANRLNTEFLDSDAEIETAAAASIAEIFARDGEAFFRDREFEVIGRLLSGEPCILSTGGGAFLSQRNRRQIHDKGISVWLDADVDLLWERVKHKDTRPLLKTENPRQTLRDLFEARVPFYRQADIAVLTRAGYSIEKTTDKVIEALLARPDVLERAE